METRKSMRCPLRIGWALAKSYGDLLNNCLAVRRKFFSNSLAVKKKILLIALLSEENFAISKK